MKKQFVSTERFLPEQTVLFCKKLTYILHKNGNELYKVLIKLKQSSKKWQANMRYMYELMQRKIKISKENAALLTVAFVLVCVSILTGITIKILGLWAFADTILPGVILVCGLALLIWILNL